eukprot:13789609-Ditylum_brightwellii.AAC.1
MLSSNDNVAPPWPPPSSSPSPPPPPKQTFEDLLASILSQVEALQSPWTPIPETQVLIEAMNCLKAWHHEYCLWKAEQRAAEAFPHLLCKLCYTVLLVPPTCVSELPPPTAQAKYVFATARFIGLGQKGPGPSPLAMQVNCAPFVHTPLKMLHCIRLLLLASQDHDNLACLSCLDALCSAHCLPPDPDPSYCPDHPAHTLDHCPLWFADPTPLAHYRPPPDPDPTAVGA